VGKSAVAKKRENAHPSPNTVMTVTEGAVSAFDNTDWRHRMPVLIIALLALAAFGLIGFLLTAAVLCESKQPKDSAPPNAAAGSIGKPV
jgi:ABC-type Fe3+-siderophore transport system permease subunit